jgi:putative heme iron utilization protein
MPDDDQAAASALETSRAIAAQARVGTLATLGAGSLEGFPYASLVNVAWDTQGRALLLLSKLAEHTKNLAAHPHASLLVWEAIASGADPLAAGRITIVGRCAHVPDKEEPDARSAYLATHPSARAYVTFADFRLFRLDPERTRYVGGFGRMAWV